MRHLIGASSDADVEKVIDHRDWIEAWNDESRPYVWTKTADQILESIARYCAPQ
jgi:hypothetical protein